MKYQRDLPQHNFNAARTRQSLASGAAAKKKLEWEHYLPVKKHLEALGYVVKGEILGCDVVALTSNDPPLCVICELKKSLTLDLFLQGVHRFAVADEVYFAVPATSNRKARINDWRARKLCRMLGIGVLAVQADGRVIEVVDPKPYKPRINWKRRLSLIDEHRLREGDPTPGGVVKRAIGTAYRQEARSVVDALAQGPRRPRELVSQLPNAQRILSRNVYGWFTRIGHGVYALSEVGRRELAADSEEGI